MRRILLVGLLLGLAVAGWWWRDRPVHQAGAADRTAPACYRLLPRATTLPPPHPFAASRGLGQAVHTLYLDHATAELAQAAGFETIVQVFAWRDLQPGPDQFDWGAADAMLSVADLYNLNLVVRLDMPPAWAKRDGGAGFPFDEAAYGRFVAALAARYQGRIRGYIIWNEPNLAAEWSRSGGQLPDHFLNFDGWVARPADYAALVGLAYHAIRQADPDALVIAGGLAPTNEISPRAYDDREFLRQLYEVGWSDCFDVLAVHGYGFGLPAEMGGAANDGLNLARVEVLRQIMGEYGDNRPVWITELGYTIHSRLQPTVSLTEQADYLAGAYQHSQREWPWVTLFTVWNLTVGRPAEDEMSGYSLVEPDGTPRPAYEKLQALFTVD
ncbi:MAG: cellulase family glycosylhydrolase [Anaerolineales bacterium]|nr:cellulase family glycosylhydrolase [Anaerolineales bacterium]